MNVDKLLVQMILEHPQHSNWSLQGMGMFRLYLSPEVRLHVWDSKYAVDDVSVIHDHPWGFVSTVVSGSLVDQVYSRRPADQGVTHHMQQIVCGPGGGPDGEPKDVHLFALPAWGVTEGGKYNHDSTTIHESKPKDGTVTIIERTFMPDTEHANVFFPVGTEWVSAEPRKASKTEVEDMAKRALARMAE